MLVPGLVAMPVSESVSRQKAELGCEAVSPELCCDHVLRFPQLRISLCLFTGHKPISYQVSCPSTGQTL